MNINTYEAESTPLMTCIVAIFYFVLWPFAPVGGLVSYMVERLQSLKVNFEARPVHVLKRRYIMHLFDVREEEPGVQRVKIVSVKGTHLDYAWVDYLSVDFNTQDWSEKLVALGYDPSKKTLFLFEKCLHNEDKAQVLSDLKRVSQISPEGSVVGFDGYGEGVEVHRKTRFRINTGYDADGHIDLFLSHVSLSRKDMVFTGKDKPYAATVTARVYK